MNEPSLKLQAGAEELLTAFPAGEPDFEAQAKAIEARVLGAATDAEPAELLKAPELAAEPGEPALASSVRSAEPPKSNFAEMARRSLQKKEDDGVELAKELLAATAQSRRPSPEMVERVRAAGKSVAAAPTPAIAADDPGRSSGVIARAEPAGPTAAPAAKGRGAIVGFVTGALALAACVALYVKTGQPESSTSEALAAEKAASLPREPHAAKAAPGAAAPAIDVKGVVSPEALAAAPTSTHAPATKATPSKAGAAPSAATPAVAPSAAVVAQAAVELEEEAQPAQGARSEPEPPAAEANLKPAEGTSGGVPLTPSAGAVSTALGSVRGNAQACLAGQTDPVSAVVTFASDGHVLRVSAAGPSGPCIQAALSKARIQPFARDSYSAPLTVRPR